MNELLIIHNMKRAGIKSVAVIQTPDNSGGYRQQLQFSSDVNEDWYAGLGAFTYVKWIGKPIDLYKQEPKLSDNIGPFHEKPRNCERPWWVDIEYEFLNIENDFL